MSHANYYLNGNNSACGTINSPLSTINYQLLSRPCRAFCNREFLIRRLRISPP
ncbi:MAG: hypothetical protein LBE12_19240 [Planctomycetaceae bacterium]|nr:hypothetical protein [Planctomycetaceae bacterium]